MKIVRGQQRSLVGRSLLPFSLSFGRMISRSIQAARARAFLGTRMFSSGSQTVCSTFTSLVGLCDEANSLCFRSL